jgi:hypothetical protein
MASAGSRRKRIWAAGDDRLRRIEVRRELAAAQSALEQAIQGRDAEAIAEARRAHAEALQRLRGLS